MGSECGTHLHANYQGKLTKNTEEINVNQEQPSASHISRLIQGRIRIKLYIPKRRIPNHSLLLYSQVSDLFLRTEDYIAALKTQPQ